MEKARQETEKDPAKGLHMAQDELSENWLEDWAGAGIGEIEAYLKKHADFLLYLESKGQVASEAVPTDNQLP